MGDRIEMRLDEKYVEDILRLVLDGGGKVLAVTPQRMSLESVFMDAVRENEK